MVPRSIGEDRLEFVSLRRIPFTQLLSPRELQWFRTAPTQRVVHRTFSDVPWVQLVRI